MFKRSKPYKMIIRNIMINIFNQGPGAGAGAGALQSNVFPGAGVGVEALNFPIL